LPHLLLHSLPPLLLPLLQWLPLRCNAREGKGVLLLLPPPPLLPLPLPLLLLLLLQVQQPSPLPPPLSWMTRVPLLPMGSLAF
jgi:hypothetical protein